MKMVQLSFELTRTLVSLLATAGRGDQGSISGFNSYNSVIDALGEWFFFSVFFLYIYDFCCLLNDCFTLLCAGTFLQSICPMGVYELNKTAKFKYIHNNGLASTGLDLRRNL